VGWCGCGVGLGNQTIGARSRTQMAESGAGKAPSEAQGRVLSGKRSEVEGYSVRRGRRSEDPAERVSAPWCEACQRERSGPKRRAMHRSEAEVSDTRERDAERQRWGCVLANPRGPGLHRGWVRLGWGTTLPADGVMGDG
jgi:hypothetical protein